MESQTSRKCDLPLPSWARPSEHPSHNIQQCQRISNSRFTTNNLQKWLTTTAMQYSPSSYLQDKETPWYFSYNYTYEEEFDWLTHYGCVCLQIISFIAILAIFSRGLGVRVLSGSQIGGRNHHDLRHDIALWDWGSKPIPTKLDSASDASHDSSKKDTLKSSSKTEDKKIRRKCVSAGPILQKRIWCGLYKLY